MDDFCRQLTVTDQNEPPSAFIYSSLFLVVSFFPLLFSIYTPRHFEVQLAYYASCTSVPMEYFGRHSDKEDKTDKCDNLNCKQA
jgi:hypothetical protein